jgi:hypothetical protein
MLLLVYTVVEAPDEGWGSARTLGGLAIAAAIMATFVAIERRTEQPLVRLGILRSSSLVRANIGAMALIGSWFGFQFMLTLYLQQARDWTALETGLALFPAGILVATLAPRVAPLVMRFGVTRVIAAGLATNGIAPQEQGLAGGLVNTSFQFGGALVLAIVTAVANANGASEGSAQGLLDGFHAAIWVSLAVAALGFLAAVLPTRRTSAELAVEGA